MAALLASAAPAMAETIDFETTGTGFVGSPFTIGSLTFSTASDLYVGNYGSQQICPTTGANCSLDLNFAFSIAASNLSFTVDGADSNSSVLSALVTFGNATTTTLTFTNLAANGTINFGALSDIVGIALSEDDASGLSYDNFRFDAAGGTGVPEPAAWALMIGGFGMAGGALRRRRTGVAFA